VKEKAAALLKEYGFILAIAGLIPIRSGILLLQDKDCGCFLVEKATLHAHSVFFGSISLAFGVLIAAAGVAYYDWSREGRARMIGALFLVSGMAVGYSMITAEEAVAPVEGEYDELAKGLTSKGWVLFYANWCPSCHAQMDLLGGSVKHLRMVDCATITCPDFVKAYPTWGLIQEGTVLEVRKGVQNHEQLEVMSR
jgi:thiol-disulfide isomerase/thioredoxin